MPDFNSAQNTMFPLKRTAKPQMDMLFTEIDSTRTFNFSTFYSRN